MSLAQRIARWYHPAPGRQPRGRGEDVGSSEPAEFHVFNPADFVMLEAGIVTTLEFGDIEAESSTPSRITRLPRSGGTANAPMAEGSRGTRPPSIPNVSVRTQFTLSPRLRLDMSRQILEEDDTTVHFSAFQLGDGQPVQPIYSRMPFSSNYGQQGEADGLAFETANTQRGGLVTLMSRIEQIRHDNDNGSEFAGESRVRLRLTDSHVEPIRMDASDSAELMEATR